MTWGRRAIWDVLDDDGWRVATVASQGTNIYSFDGCPTCEFEAFLPLDTTPGVERWQKCGSQASAEAATDMGDTVSS